MNSEVFATSLSQWAEQTPDRAAIVTDTETISYAALEYRIRQLEAALADSGITSGDRVAVCGPNRAELVELLFACTRVRAMLFVINNRLTAAEIRVQLEDCRPSLVLADAEFSSPIAEATENEFEDLDRYVEAARARVATDHPERSEPQPLDSELLDSGRSGSGRSDSGILDSELLDSGALLVYTSGTTGTPKGAILTQRSLLYTARNGLEHEGFGQESVTISVLPMFHVGGLNVQLLPCLMAGGTVILEERFDPSRLIDLLSQHQPSHLLLVPAAMEAVLDRASALEVEIGEVMASLGALNCGSSIVSVELIERFASVGVPVVQVYGATETGPTAIVLQYADADRAGSCGKPAANTELRIELPSGGEAGHGEVGELLLRGPNLFVGYWENETATSDAFTEGWYRTGDLGFVDQDGFTYVTGRTKEMIISGGENIYPAEVEQCIERHPGVEAAAVIGRPDERWGETPVAFVVASAEQEVTVSELQRWTKENLAGYKQPNAWVFVDSFPRTSLGKVQKHHLKSLLPEL